ncbi:UPF0561 protein C2orf68 homolog isoform X1 [Podarcis raffonei]|uniref:UPF0561 protein C2orf68 homolog isoform X1 n=1 Tax=Podarcis raffonei TaxID=65483 RepID=UPI00232921A7|nr:UPF0561 protein C2orf68 homolog isoform X1 [Podarcis raffonei]
MKLTFLAIKILNEIALKDLLVRRRDYLTGLEYHMRFLPSNCAFLQPSKVSYEKTVLSSHFLSRDDYDKEMKEAKEKVKKRHTPAPARPKKPDQQVYHPCRRSRAETISGLEYEGSSESSSSTEPDQLSSGPALFCLEYEADSGKITSIVVHQDNDPDEVAEKVSAQNQLEPAMREALRQRVQEELEKRRVKR